MTHRIFNEKKLVLATHNVGKIKEFSLLLSPYVPDFADADALNLPEPEETEKTFEGNAALKALAAARETGLPALADDSGFCVDALGGAPGVYSARWAMNAAGERDFGMAMARVWDEIKDDPNHKAGFVSVLALAWPDGHVETARGTVNGTVVNPPRGTGGFGYDPIFVPDGDTRTFGEMSADEKRRYSHRGKAFDRLINQCFQSKKTA